MLPLPLRLADRLRDLDTRLAQRARRNAMVGATDCARRRVERAEVTEFLAALETARAADAVRVPAPRAARG